MTRVLIVGAGSIGLLLGAKLALMPELRVTVAARAHFDRIQFDDSTGSRAIPVQVATEPSQVGPVDVIIVATKAQDTRDAWGWIRAGLGPDTILVMAQNGVDHHRRVADIVPAARVVPLIVTYGAGRTGPGRVQLTLPGAITLAALPGPPDEVASLFDLAGLSVMREEDFAAAQWLKLTTNVVGNSLTTIMDIPVALLGRLRPLRDIGALLVSECREVGRTRGIELPAGLAERMFDTFASYSGQVRSSMWQDRHHERSTEHQFLSGAVVRIGRESGVTTPVCETVTALLEALQIVAMEPGC